MTLRTQLMELADRVPLPAETLGGVAVGLVAHDAYRARVPRYL